jgi:heme-degrading monooxygenase HmoA
MFARIVTFQGKPNQVDAGIRNQREQVLPTVKKMSGFKGGYLLIDRKSGKQMVISLWDTEKDMQASSSAMGSLRTQFAKATGDANPPTVEIFEVALQP